MVSETVKPCPSNLQRRRQIMQSSFSITGKKTNSIEERMGAPTRKQEHQRIY